MCSPTSENVRAAPEAIHATSIAPAASSASEIMSATPDLLSPCSSVHQLALGVRGFCAVVAIRDPFIGTGSPLTSEEYIGKLRYENWERFRA